MLRGGGVQCVKRNPMPRGKVGEMERSPKSGPESERKEPCAEDSELMLYKERCNKKNE